MGFVGYLSRLEFPIFSIIDCTTNFPSGIDHSHIPDSPCRDEVNIGHLCDLCRRGVDLNRAAFHDMQEGFSNFKGVVRPLLKVER